MHTLIVFKYYLIGRHYNYITETKTANKGLTDFYNAKLEEDYFIGL